MEFDVSTLTAAIDVTLRAAAASIASQAGDDQVCSVAVGLVDDLTGFFTTALTVRAAAGMHPESWWLPSEWSIAAHDPSDTAPGRVTSAIWALAGGLDRNDVGLLRDAYELCIVDVLVCLRAEGLFRSADGTEPWVWLHYADAFDEGADDRTFAMIDDTSQLEAFSKRFEPDEGSLSEVLRQRIDAL